MRIKVIPHGGKLPTDAKNTVFLLTDGWDDWFKYNTMYVVFFFDKDGEQNRIGEVKIGEFEMEKDQRRPKIPGEFEILDESFFSLGQDDSYYENLNNLGDDFRDEFLINMRDVAKDLDLFER